MANYEGFHTLRGYQLLETNQNYLTPAMEDYIEMIYRLCEEGGYVRVNLLAQALHVRMPSVSRMLQKLSELELISYQKYGIVSLTGEGKEIGEYLLRRHKEVERMLHNLGVEERLLMETERMEHQISPHTFQLIAKANEFLNIHPEIQEQFSRFCHDETK
ncbi:MAG: DtxR family transcriptional regulator [Clostridiales bacterium]|nr:DtxR family transcriptional regulator [Clostridiales bacterium]